MTSDQHGPEAARRNRQRLGNRVVLRLLGSPVSGLVDAALLQLTVRDRRTGRDVTSPVQHAAGGDALWVVPTDPESNTWRNLVDVSPVTL